MTSTRREFVKAAATTAAGLAVAPLALARPARARRAPKTLLILGGTGFMGPVVQEAALSRGYAVTVFNRGRSEERRKQAGRPSAVSDGVTVLYGNRDPEKTADADNDESKGEKKDPNSPKGLTQLEGKKFDAVVDTSGYFPRMARASARLLAPNIKQYLFISTVSVYKDGSTPGADTSAELGTIPDPTVETFGASFENYGPCKALCEKEVLAALPGRATIVRPGFIVGRRDTSGRFLYWPARAERGGEMLAPGAPTDPIQLIDVRDLAEWCITLIENQTMDTFDAISPSPGLTCGTMLEACVKASANSPRLTWVPADFLVKNGLTPGGDLPIWLPPTGESAGFHTRNVAKSMKAGLKIRDINDTVKDTLAWYHSLPQDMQPKVVGGLRSEKEQEVLAAWHKEGQNTPPK